MKVQASEWSRVTAAERFYRVGDKALVVSVRRVSRRQYTALALQTELAGGFALNEAVERILDNHAHQALGTHRTMKAAQDACDQYAIGWVAGQEEAMRCACKQIGEAA